MKSKLIKDFLLPSYIEGKSFAEASKAIDKKFKGREGAEVERTKKELLSRLSKAQEYTKMQESLQANSSEVPDNMNGQVPQEMQQFAKGGWQDMDKAGKTGAVTGMAGTAMGLGNTAFGDTGVDTTGTSGRLEVGSVGGAAASGAMKGASAGAALGPWGAAVGGVVGGAAGLIGGGKAKKEALEANLNAGLIENNAFSNDFAKGGSLNGDCGGPGQPDCEDVDLNKINDKRNGVNFTQEGANSLFERMPGQVNKTPSIDLGKYKDVGYFDIGNPEGTAVTVNNTKANPHNAETIGQNMDYLRKRNPGKDINLNYNEFPKGGFLDKYGSEFDTDFNTSKASRQSNGLVMGTEGVGEAKNNNPFNKRTQAFTMDSKGVNYNSENAMQVNTNPDIKKEGNSALGKGADWVGQNYSELLRAAPIVSNGLSALNAERAPTRSLDRLDARYKKDPVDERILQNRVQNEANNTTRALASASNGSAGALRSNLLGSQLQKTNALSEAYMRADDSNRQENQNAQRFNSRNDTINLRQSNRESENADRNDAAFSNAKSALQAQFATDIGNFGKEKTNMKQVAEMFGYSWDGKYMIDKDGKKIDPKTLLNKDNKKDADK